MAAITVTYWGLTSTKGTVAVDDADSIDDLIAAVAADEGLPTNYYQLSKSTDPSNTLSSIVGDSTSQPTLDDLGIGDGDTVFCTTNQHGTKEQRQKQKLDIAAVKRNDTYDITQLPTKYDGNDVVDNPNTGGLLENRPWASTLTTSSLVVHLDAGNTNSYPGSGSTWTNLVDDTEYTIANGSFDSGDGGSIVFNGSSTVVPLGTPLSAGTNYTIEAWVIDAGPGLSSRNIVSTADDVFWVTNNNILYAGVGGSYQLVNRGSHSFDEWMHVCVTFDDDNNTITLYRNLGKSLNNSVTQSYSGGILRVGSHFSGGSTASFWNGKIAQVRVYSEALTEEQVTANYNATKATYGL